jgi:hypothetical protein
MLAESTVEIEVATGMRVGAQLRVPDDARGLVAVLGEDEPLTTAVNTAGLATAAIDLSAEAVDVEKLAAIFANAVGALSDDPALRDRPVGYFGEGIAGAAVLIAAATHKNDVAAVATRNTLPELVGMHLSDVRAPTLWLIDPSNEPLVDRTREALAPLPNTSVEVQLTTDAGLAVEWYDRYLRGLMRGARRQLWRSA